MTRPASLAQTKENAEATQGELVLRPKRWHYILYLAFCIAFTAIGLAMIMDELWLKGGFVAGCFGAGTVIFIVALLPGASTLRLTDEGFTLSSLYRRWTLAWNDVSEFRPSRVAGRPMVVFDLTGSKRKPFWRALSRGLSGGECGLPDTYGMTAATLALLMNSWRLRGLAIGTEGSASLAPLPESH